MIIGFIVIIVIFRLSGDYRELQGESIPFAKLGFKTLIDLFKSIPGFRLTQGPDGDCLIDVIPSHISKNLAELVSRQKTSKKGSGRFFSKPPPVWTFEFLFFKINDFHNCRLIIFSTQRQIKHDQWKPTVSSNYWQYKHTNRNTNNVYFKPQSPAKKKPLTPPRPIVRHFYIAELLNC